MMDYITAKAVQAVDKIVDDLGTRGGLGNVWEEIECRIQLEIKQFWVDIIKDSLTK